MDVFIDTTGAAEARPLFRLTPVDRHLRALKRQGGIGRVFLAGPAVEARVPAGLTVERQVSDAPLVERLAATLATSSNGLLVLDGGSVADPRLLAHLGDQGPARTAFGGEDAERAAVLRLEPETALPSASTVLTLADALAANGAAPALSEAETPTFIAKLRRSDPYWLFTTPDEESRRRRERWLFRLNYKGSTDVLTRWVYPPVVWPLVRLCVAWGIAPNLVTAVSVVLAFACVPLFAAGAWWPAFAMAYAMTVLDSVDGKVARLTLTDSRIGDVMDHGLDIVHPPLWYLAWAWGLGGRTLDDPAMQAGALLTAFYVVDRLVLMVAKRKFGRGLHAVTPLDGAIRTWIARRNVNLLILSVALLAGQGLAGLWVVAVWQGLTAGWHAWRTAVLPKALVA